MRYTLALSLLSALCLNWSIQTYGLDHESLHQVRAIFASADGVKTGEQRSETSAEREHAHPPVDITDYMDWYWEDGSDMLSAVVFEPDQIAKLPEATESVTLSGVRYGCFGNIERLGDAQVAELKRLPNLRRVVLSLALGDAGITALEELPALEELHILNFAPLTDEQMARLEAIPALKTCEHGDANRRPRR